MMANVKKAMRTNKPTKDDPAGTRFVGGKKVVPFAGPKPSKRPKNSVASKPGTIGRAADVDTTGMSAEDKKFFTGRR